MPEPRLREMDERELSGVMSAAAARAASALPDDTLFVLLAFDPPDEDEPSWGVAQYVSNAQREGIVHVLRESADRLERGRVNERVSFGGTTYSCARCGFVTRNPEHVRRRYCGRCHGFEGDDGG